MPQHLDSLKYANEIRLGRAVVKQDVRTGKVAIKDLLDDIPECLNSATVYEIIFVQHRWGRTRTLKLLKRLQFSEYLTFGKMTDRQKYEFRKELELQEGGE